MSRRGDTKTRILDAAENLFGANGFESVSLRDITAAAQVNLAAVNYHFQSKDHLIDAVIARRIEPVNQRRLELLGAAPPDASVEQILEAFLRPVLEVRRSPQLPLMGRMLANPELFADRIFPTHLAPVAKRFAEALHRALPALPMADILWRLHFSVGAMTHTLLWGGVLPRMTGGLCSVEDRPALLARLIQFLAAGFRAAAVDLRQNPYASPVP
jgi:AcrR family transcriptional regulator